MKIEKGKLYYDLGKEKFFKGIDGFNSNSEFVTDKIAVHCPTKEDWDYVVSKGYSLTKMYYGDSRYGLYSGTFECGYYSDDYHIISIDEFKQFYPEEECTVINAITDKIGGNVQNNGHKETNNKLNYELDFDFITQMSERMQTNKGKYEPYNWMKPIDVESLKQALFRHVIEVMKGNYQDDGRLHGHLEAISCNAMMLNYQLKNK